MLRSLSYGEEVFSPKVFLHMKGLKTVSCFADNASRIGCKHGRNLFTFHKAHFDAFTVEKFFG